MIHSRRFVLLTLLLLFPAVKGTAQVHQHDALPNLDQRAGRSPTPEVAAATEGRHAVREQAAAALRVHLPKLQVEFDPLLRTPKWLADRDGFLTGTNGVGRAGSANRMAALPGDDRHRVIKAFVNEHAGLFGHDATALEQARIRREYVAEHNGLHSVVWQQEHSELEVYGAVFLAHVTRAGELVNVSGQFLPDLPAAAERGQGTRGQAAAPEIAPREAVQRAAAHLGDEEDSQAVVEAQDEPAGPERRQRFRSPILRGEATTRLIWLPLDADVLKLCWEVTLKSRHRNEVYRLLMDAEDGEVWVRQCLTEYLSSASYRVFTSDSPTPFSPAYTFPGNPAQPATVPRTLITLTALNTNASPNGWINDGINELRGNNVDAYSDINDVDAPDLPRPIGSPSRVFDFALDLTKEPATYRSAAIANLFYWNNWIHDKFWELGFTEAAGNFQNNNFGRGGLGNDAVNAEAQDGSGVENANFQTDVDGVPPRMQMYLWKDPVPGRDGDLDAQIIIHEYTHGLSNRRVGGGVLITAYQTKAMGEGWSDFYAHALLSQAGDALDGNYPLGSYALYNFTPPGGSTPLTDNYYFGIRRYPLSTKLSVNPLTFKDIDPAQASSHSGVPKSPIGWSAISVHSMGEVWCAALWEVRANLINRHGYATGHQLALQLVTDGMGLCPPNPNFLQARDAILQADLVLTGGSNRTDLWAGFAKRGMGIQATSPNSTSASGVKESFDFPDDLKVTLINGPLLSGPSGGPLSPAALTFALTNEGNATISWQAHPGMFLTASVSGGTLAPNAQTLVEVSIPAAVLVPLPDGFHRFEITFSNQTSGAQLKRAIPVRLGDATQTIAESFSGTSGDNFDLAFKRLTFTPAGPGGLSAPCLETIATLPTSPLGGNVLSLGDEGSQEIVFSNGKTFPYSGTNYGAVFVSANGYLTLGAADASYKSTLEEHFAKRRISVLFRDLTPGAGSTISWRQLADRVAVTWQDLKQFSGTASNTFQAELYFDGRISLAFLACQSTTALTGLSAGNGIPPNFMETDLSSSGLCSVVPLAIEAPAALTEGAGTVTGAANVRIPQPQATNLTVTLASSDPSELTVPASVVIPAGSTNALFNLTVQDDAIADGTQASYIFASASAYLSASRIVRVHDNEVVNLGLSFSAPASEGGGVGSGTVTLSTPAGDLVAVNLTSDNPDEANVPGVVFVPTGGTNVNFTFTTTDDSLLDGTRTVPVTASVENWPFATANATSLDNEVAQLSMTLPFLLNESMGTLTNAGTVSVSGILASNLLVAILSDDESEVRFPLFGVVIPAGQSNVSFPVLVMDDAVVDGAVFVRVRALATGFTSATNFVWVGDNDGPPEPFDPEPADGAIAVSVETDLRWGRVEGNLIVNGDFETGNLSGWTRADIGVGGFVVSSGTYDPTSPDAALPPLAGNYSALSDQLGNGRHALQQDIVIPAAATSVTLQWSDRIRNHAGTYDTNQQFRVELRSPTNNALLGTIFSTPTNHPAMNDWTIRSGNLSVWRGQSVRLVFVQEDALGYLNVHLDNISVVAGSAVTTFFDVYLGTNNPPVTADYQGTTTNSHWELPMLAGGRNYYWQLKARRSSVTNAGPVWRFTTEGSSAAATYFSMNSVWRYRNTGQDLGTSWTNLTYNDSAWPSGAGILGFGGSQNTLIGSAANGYVTYYFRRTFNVTDASRVATLTARLIRDDGAIVWINGQPAIWSNMPNPPVNYQTYASTENTGFFQVLPFTYQVDPGILVNGTNIVAVEVHQRHPRGALSDDLYFDLELKALVNTGNESPTVRLTSPANFSRVTHPANVSLSAAVVDDGLVLAGHAVDFYANGLKLGTDTLVPFNTTWVSPPVGRHVLTAVVTDPGGLISTSSPIHLLVAPASGAVMTLIPPGATWLYNDSEESPGADWMTPTHRVGRDWKSGPAQLGYGEGDEATVIDHGRNLFYRPITTWFRHNFSHAVNLNSTTLRVLRDDGVAVYLNGSEVLRNNLPAGTLTHTTLASATIAGAAETVWVTAAIATPPLAPGNHLLAVEIHQDGSLSPDHSFDLELTGIGNPRPTVTLTSPSPDSWFVAPTNVLITADAFDPYGTVSQVQFFRNGVSLGTANTAPYQVNWSHPPGGLHALTAVATDTQGATNTSATRIIAVLIPTALAIESQHTEGRLVLTWPAEAVGYQIQFATNLAPPINWNNLTDLPVLTNGQFRLELERTNAQRYFRLQGP